MVEAYLARGGVGWPDIPGLIDRLPGETEPTADPSSSESDTLQATALPETVSPSSVSPTDLPGILPTDSGRPGWLVRFSHDPYGNTLSVLALMGMLGSLVWVVAYFPRTQGVSAKDLWAWSIPLLCTAGLGVAGYLAYVETSQVTAVCGPVGDCNTVQQSEYAHLFGFLPIGILGLLGYMAIIVAWLVARYSNDYLANLAVISLFIMTVFGTLFSIYLTFLEPFVIGATCIWCLTSAVLMTALMLLAVRPAKLALSENFMFRLTRSK